MQNERLRLVVFAVHVVSDDCEVPVFLRDQLPHEQPLALCSVSPRCASSGEATMAKQTEIDDPTTSVSPSGAAIPLNSNSGSSSRSNSARRRSMSGPGHSPTPKQNASASSRLETISSASSSAGRTRRTSGDDSLSPKCERTPSSTGAISKTGPAAWFLFDAFRRRSKSDSKSKRPNLIAAIKNSIPWSEHRSNSHDSTQGGHHLDVNRQFHGASCPVTPNHLDPYYTYSYQGEYRSRSRSGSGSSGSGHPGMIPRVYDIFRNRSQTLAAPTELKACRVSRFACCLLCCSTAFRCSAGLARIKLTT